MRKDYFDARGSEQMTRQERTRRMITEDRSFCFDSEVRRAFNSAGHTGSRYRSHKYVAQPSVNGGANER